MQLNHSVETLSDLRQLTADMFVLSTADGLGEMSQQIVESAYQRLTHDSPTPEQVRAIHSMALLIKGASNAA